MAFHKIEADGYRVYIGSECFSVLQTMLEAEAYVNAKKVILVDENTHQHCLPMLLTNVEALHGAEVLEIESGEEHKNLEVCYGLWSALSEFQADRKTVLINLGGGVIGDMGGFIASTYKRGIRFINLPTTLLSQVDASVGGKVGIDLDGLKNQIGVFNNPEAVLIVPEFLRTLGKDQLISGFAEVIKHALIFDAEYWEMVFTTNLGSIEALEDLIEHSIEIKNQIVTEDPKEQGVRKLLNFGHTIGHAIETFSLESEGKNLLHGEAIAIGIICESYLSKVQGGITEDQLREITDFILSFFPVYTVEEMSYHRLIELMRNDKKNEDGAINFTLLTDIGRAVVNQTFHSDKIIEALEFYRAQVKAHIA